jgi:hypothetical protein
LSGTIGSKTTRPFFSFGGIMSVIKIYPYRGNRFIDINVYKPVKVLSITGKYMKHTEIGWPSIGCQTADDTELFAKGLLEAVRIARKLNTKIK